MCRAWPGAALLAGGEVVFRVKVSLCLLALILPGCGPRLYAPDFALPDAALALDLEQVPQDTLFFAAKAEQAGLPALLTPEAQAELAAGAAARFFSPWSGLVPRDRPERLLPASYGLSPERLFAENLRPVPRERWEELLRNSDLDSYPNRALPAITVRACSLRLLPSRTPYFFDPAGPGEGYPFDALQNSSLALGTPVFITHISLDKAWTWVEAPYAGGWTETEGLALAGDAFRARWLGLPMAAVLGENMPLRLHPAAAFGPEPPLPAPPRFVSIGAVLPYAEYAGAFGPLAQEEVPLYFPERGEGAYARIRQGRLPASGLAPWPRPLTRENLAGLAARMLGQPYGWGGYAGNRDCSAALRDLFLPFGLWLPRNSRAQAALGRVVDLSGLGPGDKERVILEQGRPFGSLVSQPGHIALYLGEYQGRAVIFHNIWGLRVKRPGSDIAGRAVIGKAVLTSLSPGQERPDIFSPNSLLDSLDKLSFPLEESLP